MQNQINQNLQPQQANYSYSTMPMAPVSQPVYNNPQPQVNPGQVQTYPVSGNAAAVNIQIFNPTANATPQGFYQPVACNPYPCNYNNSLNNQVQYQAPNPSEAYSKNMTSDNASQMMNNKDVSNVAGQGQGLEGAKTEEKKANTPKVALTDDYVKTLENYLNSQDKKIRLMGARELFERFKEDETRKDDAALTALLNKTLQDPAETVKFVALTALDAGYATGNNETAQILTQMQSSTSSYGEDAALASKVLLKMSGYKANADAQAQLNGVQTEKQNSLNMNQNPEILPELNMANQMQATNSKLPQEDGVLAMPNANMSMNQNTLSTNQPMVEPIGK